MLVHPDLGRERSDIHYTNQIAEHKAPGLLDGRHCTHLSPMHVLAQYENKSNGARKLRAYIASMPSTLECKVRAGELISLLLHVATRTIITALNSVIINVKLILWSNK